MFVGAKHPKKDLEFGRATNLATLSHFEVADPGLRFVSGADLY